MIKLHIRKSFCYALTSFIDGSVTTIRQPSRIDFSTSLPMFIGSLNAPKSLLRSPMYANSELK